MGGFLLIEQIGQGGMGTVFRAERADGGFAQQAAVKIIDVPARNAVVLRRFQSGRQILATLSHPHIVSLLDGGLTDHGQAYLVMEYVDGGTMTRYCAERRAPLAERLALFRQVCAAVQHAHQRGVVHRDLKPANILVSADGMSKVLDFGIAKLLDADEAAGGGALTSTAAPAALTTNYASPEQLRACPSQRRAICIRWAFCCSRSLRARGHTTRAGWPSTTCCVWFWQDPRRVPARRCPWRTRPLPTGLGAAR